MSDKISAPPTQQPPSPTARRQSFTELYASRPSMQRPQPNAMSAAVSQQAQEASRTRRLSISTIGLSGSPTHGQTTTPFGSLRRGTGSLSESGSASALDDNAVDESDTIAPLAEERSASGSSPTPGRRMSFGARAAFNAGVRSASLSYPSATSPGGSSSSTGAAAGVSRPAGPSPPPGGMKREGYNFGDNMRNRAKRASISGQSGGTGFGSAYTHGHTRSRSQALENTAPAQPATPAAPKPKPKPNVPDAFQERILRGDFSMD